MVLKAVIHGMECAEGSGCTIGTSCLIEDHTECILMCGWDASMSPPGCNVGGLECVELGECTQRIHLVVEWLETMDLAKLNKAQSHFPTTESERVESLSAWKQIRDIAAVYPRAKLSWV